MDHRHEPHRPEHTGHDAHAGHEHVHGAMSRGRLLASMALTGGMMIVEFVGGFLTGSLALVSDAGHMFTHFFALGISYFAIRIAARPAGPEKSFGLYRSEILAAFVNGLFLAGATVYIAYESVRRFLHPIPIAGFEMFVIALVGLAVNLASAGILWRVCREDLNIRSAFFHMLADTLSSVAVVAGALVIAATGFLRIDPVLSAIISILIGLWSYRLLAQSVRILLEATPPGLDLGKLQRSLAEADPAVRGVHDLHVWQITSGMLAMTAIVAVDPSASVTEASGIQERLRGIARDRFGIGHAIFQVEPSALRDP